MLLGDSVEIDEALLVLKVAFLVLLYLFIWRIVRTASRDIRVPQESMVVAPGAAAAPQPRRPAARLVVVRSPTLAPGHEHALDSAAVSVGRGGQNDIELAGDDYASAAHARFTPQRDGVWLEDVGSTNGTFVNGIRIDAPRRLQRGDVVRVGETDLRFEA